LRALNFSKLSEKTVNGICHCEGLKRPITLSLRGALATKQSYPSAKVLRLLHFVRNDMLLYFARNDRDLVSAPEGHPTRLRPRGDSAPAGKGV